MQDTDLSFKYETTSSKVGKFILFLVLGFFLLLGIILLLLAFIGIGANGDLLDGMKFILPGTTIIRLALGQKLLVLISIQ